MSIVVVGGCNGTATDYVRLIVILLLLIGRVRTCVLWLRLLSVRVFIWFGLFPYLAVVRLM